MSYKLTNEFAEHSFIVAVVGCGGTGGFAAEGLCRILPSHAQLILIDPDRVEERNLVRQNFTQQDLGCFKSEALAHSLTRKTDRAIGYSTLPIGMVKLPWNCMVLGCVDNGLARRDIAEGFDSFHSRWWVDAGNGENYGQILIGNADEKINLKGAFEQKINTCLALPLPTVQMPGLLVQVPRVRNCAEAVEAGEQGPTINQVMASLMLEVVRRIIEGTCPWMQLFVDMDTGTLSPVMATPEAVEGIVGLSTRKLVDTE